MRFLTLVPLLAAFGCAYESTHTPGGTDGGIRTHSVRFAVFLDGNPCEDVPEVSFVHVHVDDPHQQAVDTDVTCPTSDELIIVPGFVEGQYPWTLTAYDANGYPRFEGSGTVAVDSGSPIVTADLTPSGTPAGRLVFRWRFGRDGLRCSQVGAEDVQVTIGKTSIDVPCSPESASEGYAFDVPAGDYDWQLAARGSEKDVLYLATGDLSIDAGEIVDIDASLIPHVVPPEPGTLIISWTFDGKRSCNTREIETVTISVFDGTTLERPSASVACQAIEARLPQMRPGRYLLDLTGNEKDGTQIYGASGVPVTIESSQVTEIEVDLGLL